MTNDQFKLLVVIPGMIVGMLIAIVFAVSCNAYGEEYKPFVWMYNPDGQGLVVYPQVIEPDEDEPVEVEVKEPDVLEYQLERELLRQEERRYQWMQNDYRDFLREHGVQEGLMRGW